MEYHDQVLLGLGLNFSCREDALKRLSRRIGFDLEAEWWRHPRMRLGKLRAVARVLGEKATSFVEVRSRA